MEVDVEAFVELRPTVDVVPVQAFHDLILRCISQFLGLGRPRNGYRRPIASHMGLLSVSANEENMRLKLTLILCSLLSLGATECVK